jgi:hypothetical protein
MNFNPTGDAAHFWIFTTADPARRLEMKINKVMEGPRDGEVRCLTCFERFRPSEGSDRAKCPKCGVEWRISWPYPKTARVRGPVWENYPLGTDEKI